MFDAFDSAKVGADLKGTRRLLKRLRFGSIASRNRFARFGMLWLEARSAGLYWGLAFAYFRWRLSVIKPAIALNINHAEAGSGTLEIPLTLISALLKSGVMTLPAEPKGS